VTHRQRVVLRLVLLWVGVSAAVPPWTREAQVQVGHDTPLALIPQHEYAPLWSPPTPDDLLQQALYTFKVDWSRLLLSWVTVAALGGAFLAFERKPGAL
jgi:hypothetical protein